MSNISTQHSFVPFVSGESKALEGQRLSKVLYKGTEKSSVCVSVPKITELTAEELQILKPYVISMLEDTQDKITKVRYESGNLSVSDSELSLAACIEALEVESSSSRLTKEFVAKWFQESLAEKLIVALADKLGVSDVPTPAQEAQLEKLVENYQEKISGLAGGKTSYPKPIAEKLLKAVSLASSEDILAQRFTVRLDKMITKQAEEEMLGL